MRNTPFADSGKEEMQVSAPFRNKFPDKGGRYFSQETRYKGFEVVAEDAGLIVWPRRSMYNNS